MISAEPLDPSFSPLDRPRVSRPSRTTRSSVAFLALCIAIAGPSIASADVARGDAAWARRADGQLDGRARVEPIDEAIAAFTDALDAEPARLDAYWKLMRAHWFRGEFATTGTDDKRADFDRGLVVAKRAYGAIAVRLGGNDTLDRLAPDDLRRTLAPADVGAVAHICCTAWFVGHYRLRARPAG